jgi:hypothetical protein
MKWTALDRKYPSFLPLRILFLMQDSCAEVVTCFFRICCLGFLVLFLFLIFFSFSFSCFCFLRYHSTAQRSAFALSRTGAFSMHASSHTWRFGTRGLELRWYGGEG